jgi:hypothetical protein
MTPNNVVCFFLHWVGLGHVMQLGDCNDNSGVRAAWTRSKVRHDHRRAMHRTNLKISLINRESLLSRVYRYISKALTLKNLQSFRKPTFMV